LIVGTGVTYTIAVSELTHPAELLATTVYNVVTVGLSTMVDVNAIGEVNHVYVLAPMAVSVTVVPTQIEFEGATVIVSIGTGLTIT